MYYKKTIKRLFVILCILFSLNLIWLSYNTYGYLTGCSTCNMYKQINETQFGLNGIYFHNQYYCVWVGDKTRETINDTIIHEECHHLVSLANDHFCR